MTVRDRERDDDLFDPLVAACMQRAADDVPVNVEVEWVRLVDRVAREAQELASIAGGRGARAGAGVAGGDPAAVPAPRTRLWSSGPLLAVAAVIVVLLVIAGPVFVRTTVTVVHFVQDVVEVPDEPLPDPVTTTSSVMSPRPTFAPVPPPTPTPTSPPPPTTVPPPATTTTPPPATDLAHAPIRDGNEYRLTLRRVHDQLNAAIGFGRNDYEALDGADDLVESLLGRQPQYDARLRDVIGHIRQARGFSDRNAASAAHTIVEEIERALAVEAGGAG